jgi:PAS domain S-box-containing protein
MVNDATGLDDGSPPTSGPAAPTERVPADDGLWRDIVESSPFSTLIYDAEGRILAANAAFRTLWGVGLDSAPPGYSVLTDPELERQGVLHHVRRAFAGETVTTPLVRYDISRVSTTGAGRTLWTQGHLYPLRDGSGRVTHVVLTHIDLTERVRAEEALRASERRFGAIVHQASAGIAQVDLTGRFVLVNDRYCALVARSREELLGLRMQDITHPEDLPANLALLGRALETGEPFTIEKRYLRPDGSAVWVSNSVAAVHDEGETPTSVLAVSVDVTDRRRAEEIIRLLAEAGRVLSSSLDYRATLRNVAGLLVPAAARWSMVFLLDDGIVPVATACATPEGTAAVEGMARCVARLSPSEPHLARTAIETGEPQLVRSLDRRFLDSVSRDPEYRRLLRELAPVSLIAAPLLAHGRTLGALVLATDDPARPFDERDLALAAEVAQRAAVAVDNAHLYDAERAARAEAEGASRAKSDFLAKMSHELRTPLNAIGGYAELVEIGVHGPVTAEQREALVRIQINQRHLLNLINDILDFSRVEAGALRLLVEELDVRAVLSALEPLIGPQMRRRGIDFEIAYPRGPLAVRGDRERIVQICLNLLSNALKATPPGGRVLLACEPAGDRVAFRVRDTGVGIAGDQLEAIFNPFTQVGRALSRPQEGVGLGLAISRELARAMQGELAAESEPGAGSVFTLTVPRADGGDGSR